MDEILRYLVDVMSELVEVQPALRPELEEHIDAFGEMHSHVFLSDVMRWLIPRIATDPMVVRSVIDWLEERYITGPEIVRNMIVVSFVEMIPSPGEVGSELRDMLGPTVRAQDFYHPKT